MRPSTYDTLRRFTTNDPDISSALGMMAGLYETAIRAHDRHEAYYRSDTHKPLDFPPQLSDEPQSKPLFVTLSNKAAEILFQRYAELNLTSDQLVTLDTVVDEAAATAEAILRAGDEAQRCYIAELPDNSQNT